MPPAPHTEQPLLRTKVSIPRIAPEFVHRPRLTERINRGVRGPLTLLSAPAGFGKTNLLIEWAAQTSLSVAWLTLDREDNDLVRFFRYLTCAFQEVAPRLGEEALDIIQTTKGSGLEMGLTYLINEISALPGEMALVLDEFQVLDDASIHESLRFLLKHLPSNLHLVIASRGRPALDLASLRARRQVVELGAGELRFTEEEVARFFQQTMDLQLPPETVRLLEQRTDGWITALQMAAISLRQQADPMRLLANLQGDAHYLVDFLAEEVLNRQPEEVRRFLLRSSILDVLSGPLCEAVVDPGAPPGYGAEMLERLERANLFIIALDETHVWFRYHHLFADFLRHVQAEIQPAETPGLQKRAALWFEQHGNLDEAYKYGLAAGDDEWAADLIERNIQDTIRSGEIFALARWIGKLPGAVLHKRPQLSLAYAWGLIAGYRLDNARFWLDDLQQTLDAPEKYPGADPARLAEIHGGLAVCRSTLALLNGDIQQAGEYSQEALRYLSKDNPFSLSLLMLEDSLYFTLSGDTTRAIASLRETARVARQANNLLVMIIATCELADMQAMQGQLSQAVATLQKAQWMAVGPDEKALPLAGIADIGLGEILRERNHLDEAREYLERGCRVTQVLWPLSSLDGMVSLARLLQTQGDTAGSQALIAGAARMALSTESSQWDDAFTSATAARLALQRGDLAAAVQWWQKPGLPDLTGDGAPQNYPYQVLEYLQLTQARFDLATGLDSGDPRPLRRALVRLQTLLAKAETFQRVTSQIEILVVQAMLQAALGQPDPAVGTMLRALRLGEAEGYRRIFLDEGRPAAELIAACQSAPRDPGEYLPTRAYIHSLLADARRENGAPAPALARPNPAPEEEPPALLTAREVEVLSLIAEGRSNQEISAELCLSLNTVKRHAYNIYTKLGVRKRTQAVQKARQAGLIP